MAKEQQVMPAADAGKGASVSTMPHKPATPAEAAAAEEKAKKERGPMTVTVAVRRINLVLDQLRETTVSNGPEISEAEVRAINAVRAMRGLP
jgi:hypothetical protein